MTEVVPVAAPPTPERAARERYRDTIRQAFFQSQADYDKTLITLSSGALGISIVFVKDVIGSAVILRASLLLSAWLLWAGSLTITLGAFLTGALFLDRALTMLKDLKVTADDTRKTPNRIQTGAAVLSGLLFVGGVVCISLFAYYNLGRIDGQPRL
jgi:hypothetical protein